MMKEQVFAIAMATVLIGTGAHTAMQVASRDQEFQAPREREPEMQAPRGQELQAPRGQTAVQTPRDQDAQPR